MASASNELGELFIADAGGFPGDDSDVAWGPLLDARLRLGRRSLIARQALLEGRLVADRLYIPRR